MLSRRTLRWRLAPPLPRPLPPLPRPDMVAQVLVDSRGMLLELAACFSALLQNALPSGVALAAQEKLLNGSRSAER